MITFAQKGKIWVKNEKFGSKRKIWLEKDKICSKMIKVTQKILVTTKNDNRCREQQSLTRKYQVWLETEQIAVLDSSMSEKQGQLRIRKLLKKSEVISKFWTNEKNKF